MLSAAEQDSMRKAGKIVSATLQTLARMAQPGVTTTSLAKIAETKILKAGGVPSCKGYNGFPAAVCISINDEVIHGVPDGRPLQEGDIVTFDLVVAVDGIHADSAVTVPVGQVTEDAMRIMRTARTALYHAVELAKPGTHLLSLSLAIFAEVQRNKLGLLKNFGGHGIGRKMHEDPFVSNTPGPITDMLRELKTGEAVAIEPMVVDGDGSYRIKEDGWTVEDPFGRLSAHFEHTVLITADGHEIITEWDDDSLLPPRF